MAARFASVGTAADAVSSQVTHPQLPVWRLPAAFAAWVGLTVALAAIGTSLWLSVCLGGLAGLRVAIPFASSRRSNRHG
jgi:hypothetical protein